MVKRICVEKKTGFNVEAESLKKDLIHTLKLKNLESVRIINVYDLEDVNMERLKDIKKLVLSEPNVDLVTEDSVSIGEEEEAFRVELLPGQYDQRADSAAQCIEIITLENAPAITSSKIIILKGLLSSKDVNRIKDYLINPVESREVPVDIPSILKIKYQTPHAVLRVQNGMPVVINFIKISFSFFASFSITPVITSIPWAFKIPIPLPATRGFGSFIAMITFFMPFLIIALAQGGVLPK